jgi:hypothetical protein
MVDGIVCVIALSSLERCERPRSMVNGSPVDGDEEIT